MKYKALKTLIDSDAGNAAKTDAQVLTWLEETVTIQNDATIGEVLEWCANNDIINNMETHSLGVDETKRGIADAALTLVRSGQGLSLTKASVQTLIASMVALSMITQTESDALYALAQETKTRWANAGLTQPLESHVNVARSL